MRTGVLGLVIPDIMNPFYLPIARQIDRVMNKRSYNVILCNTEEDPAREHTYIYLLRQREVDGLIIAPSNDNYELLVNLHLSGKPVVLIDRNFPSIKPEQLPSVVTENVRGSFDATYHLIAYGHRRILLLLNSLPLSTSEERFQGYRQALAEAGIPFNPALVKRCPSTVDDARQLVPEILALPEAPTAIFATDGLLTVGTLIGLKDQGWRCPDDISVVGYDDLRLSAPLGPDITTVTQPVHEIGQRAAELFLAYIDGRAPNHPETCRLQAQLLVGTTSGPVATAGRPAR